VGRATGRPLGRPKPFTGNKVSPNIAITDVFIKNKQSKHIVIANRGGARSSKSYSIIQLLVERFFGIPGRQILMLRKTLPALRKSTYKDTMGYIERLGLSGRIQEHKQEMTLDYGASTIQFGALDDPSKIKSTQWNDIFMEEATEFTYEDFVILRTRLSAPVDKKIPNQLYLAFNPEDEYHWLKTKVIEEMGDVEEIVSNYKANPFLSEDYIKVLLDLEFQDPNYYRIYTLGEWGKLENQIYSNWGKIDYWTINPDETIFGIDFGFNNPSVLVKVAVKEFNAWVDELIYQPGLTNPEFISAVSKQLTNEEKRRCYVFADSAEPDRIKEFEDAGFNVVAAEKDVHDGIDTVRRYKLNIMESANNILKEIRSYSWKKDRKTERILDDPIKFNNHAMDALRYALHTYTKEYCNFGPTVRFL
jgi:phage terminase large subunit